MFKEAKRNQSLKAPSRARTERANSPDSSFSGSLKKRIFSIERNEPIFNSNIDLRPKTCKNSLKIPLSIFTADQSRKSAVNNRTKIIVDSQANIGKSTATFSSLNKSVNSIQTSAVDRVGKENYSINRPLSERRANMGDSIFGRKMSQRDTFKHSDRSFEDLFEFEARLPKTQRSENRFDFEPSHNDVDENLHEFFVEDRPNQKIRIYGTTPKPSIEQFENKYKQRATYADRDDISFQGQNDHDDFCSSRVLKTENSPLRSRSRSRKHETRTLRASQSQAALGHLDSQAPLRPAIKTQNKIFTTSRSPLRSEKFATTSHGVLHQKSETTRGTIWGNKTPFTAKDLSQTEENDSVQYGYDHGEFKHHKTQNKPVEYRHYVCSEATDLIKESLPAQTLKTDKSSLNAPLTTIDASKNTLAHTNEGVITTFREEYAQSFGVAIKQSDSLPKNIGTASIVDRSSLEADADQLSFGFNPDDHNISISSTPRLSIKMINNLNGHGNFSDALTSQAVIYEKDKPVRKNSIFAKDSSQITHQSSTPKLHYQPPLENFDRDNSSKNLKHRSIERTQAKRASLREKIEKSTVETGKEKQQNNFVLREITNHQESSKIFSKKSTGIVSTSQLMSVKDEKSFKGKAKKNLSIEAENLNPPEFKNVTKSTRTHRALGENISPHSTKSGDNLLQSSARESNQALKRKNSKPHGSEGFDQLYADYLKFVSGNL